MKKDTDNSNHRILQALGGAIRFRRRHLGLTQGELAVMAGVSINLLCQIENGKSTAQIGKVLDIITVLGMQFVLDNGKNRVFLKEEFTT